VRRFGSRRRVGSATPALFGWTSRTERAPRKISAELSGVAKAISSSVSACLDPTDLPARWFGEQVVASRSDQAQMALWASSTVIDDNVQGPVFDEQVFSWLHRGAPGAFRFPIGHAGLMHTYGYLLSSVETPYGLKRQRWLTEDLANAFGLDPSFFFPTASSVPLMERVASQVLPVLVEPTADPRTILAFDEVVDHRRRMRTAYIHNPETNSTAVMYGSVNGEDVRIVSAFPIQPITEEWARARLREPTRYRYNFAPSGAPPGSDFIGTTEELKSSV
jgi:hypothetical protein